MLDVEAGWLARYTHWLNYFILSSSFKRQAIHIHATAGLGVTMDHIGLLSCFEKNYNCNYQIQDGWQEYAVL